MAKGVLAGAVGLVAAPAIGAQQEGFAGFAKGAGAGIAGAVVLPVTGIVVGAAQLVRGLANTPEAFRESGAGKAWDEERRVWVSDPGSALMVDDEEINRPAREAWQAAEMERRGEDDLYALLGVLPGASAEEIRRQYYLLARQTHPDKNPDDPEASARFQKLGQAYQVLSNPDLRARYDAHGSEALDVNFVDGAAFFTALFGSDRFEHLVGELVLAAAAREEAQHHQSNNRTQASAAAAVSKRQAARERRLATLLSALLRRWVEGDEEGFRSSMGIEAGSLAKASYGELLLATIGGVYRQQAEIAVGGFFEGSVAALRARGHAIKSQFNAANLALKVYKTQTALEKLEAEEKRAATTSSRADAGEDAETTFDQQQEDAERAKHAAAAAVERARLEEASLPLMLEAMWAANVLDIQSTLRHVTRAVLYDKAVDKGVRARRAEALLELGKIFVAAAGQAAESQGQKEAARPATGEDARRRMEDAMMRVIEKKAGQEPS